MHSNYRNTRRPWAAPLVRLSGMALGICLAWPTVSIRAQAQVSSDTQVELQSALVKTIESTTLAAQLAGMIQTIDVTEGDVVEAGQKLGRIRDEAVRLKLEQLEMQVAQAQAKLENDIDSRLAEKSREVAENEYMRAVAANERVPGTYPLNEVDRLRLVADRAALEVERAEFQRKLAEFEVQVAKSEYRQSYELFRRHLIESPADGVVVAVEKRRGEWVEPGSELVRIVRIDRLRIEGFVTARQAMAGLEGQPVTVRLMVAGESPSTTGRVVFVSPDVNPVNSQVRVFVEVDNHERALRPGLQVRAVIHTQP